MWAYSCLCVRVFSPQRSRAKKTFRGDDTRGGDASQVPGFFFALDKLQIENNTRYRKTPPKMIFPKHFNRWDGTQRAQTAQLLARWYEQEASAVSGGAAVNSGSPIIVEDQSEISDAGMEAGGVNNPIEIAGRK